MLTESLHHEIDIDVSPEKVFDFLTDPHNVPLVVPGLIENTDIPPLPLQRGSRFMYRYQMLGVVLEGAVTIEQIERPAVYDFTTSGGGESTWKQRILPRNGGTRFTLEIAYNPPHSWLEKVRLEVVRQMNQTEAEQYLKHLKTLLEMQALPLQFLLTQAAKS
jgi:carbon monoxide dehydrogenase subunit G